MVGTSSAILYSLQLVCFISCTADTQRNPTPLTLTRFFPPPLHLSCKKETQEKPAPAEQVSLSNPGQGEKQILCSKTTGHQHAEGLAAGLSSTPCMLLQGGVRREIKDEASALNKYLR